MSSLSAIFHRDLEATSLEATGHRQLQFQGDRCDPNVLETASKNPDLSTFVDLIYAADLQDIYLCAGPFTLLAPTNEAFAGLDPAVLKDLLRPENQKLLQEVLLYHILPGFQPSSQLQAGPTETLLYGFDVDVGLNPITFNNAAVVRPDIMACNGVIHTIDDVLIPNKQDFCDAFAFGNSSLPDGGQNCEPNVLETARQNPDLSTVVSLIEAAGLADVFTCAGPFTALFPNNAAFDALDPAYVDFLLDPAHQSQLQDLLLYQILPGATTTSEFTPGPKPTLLMGETVDVTKSPTIMFDDAGVVTPNVVACNGYINVIDTVLMPFAAPAASPTVAPTIAPTPMSICDAYTFMCPTQRVRKLQNGGANCDTNVLDTARGIMDLSIVTTLFDLAGLTDIFSCPGPFTALFPSNTAFDKVDPAFLDSLVDPANVKELQNFLLYSVLPCATLSNQFTAGPKNTLFEGNQVNVTLNPLQFNSFGLSETDIQACNGYIDILNGVLNPFAMRKFSPARPCSLFLPGLSNQCVCCRVTL